uniref:WalW protein n=1 Tax=Magnetococcus massalia (strain MO-1) TaxID=451514 RepID=A0A1S7LPD7_MAGMO|nr:Conserved protein of unknown function. putative WalW protein [Candidatus Magnetococcus massalia]
MSMIETPSLHHPQLQPLQLPENHPPTLQVVVDTEESFDWSAPFDPTATDVSHMEGVLKPQEIFNRFGLRPIYVVDYPVASQPAGYGPLKELLEKDQCRIGAHLHPWVNPPAGEEVNRHNAYPGNLPEPLERAKLTALTQMIEQNFAQRPTLYKAGRYGFGPHTAQILASLGYQIDLSPSPGFDFSADGGPNHTGYGNHPFRFTAAGSQMTCIPTTGGFMGPLADHGPTLYPPLQSSVGRTLRLEGLLSKSGLFSRQRLSPEGFSLEENRRLTRWLLKRGVRLFTLSFHSPSWQPGNTPYVKSRGELETFLAHLQDYCHFFMEELEGVALPPEMILQRLQG